MILTRYLQRSSVLTEAFSSGSTSEATQDTYVIGFALFKHDLWSEEVKYNMGQVPEVTSCLIHMTVTCPPHQDVAWGLIEARSAIKVKFRASLLFIVTSN